MTTLVDLDAVTVAGYALRTGDTTSAASAVTGALVEAESLLDEYLRRHLAFDSRTDAFRIYPDARVYPDAYPITVASLTIDGRALLGATPDIGPFVGGWEAQRVDATVTWSGGFDDGTDSEPLPTTLAHALYDLASASLHSSGSGIPAGANNASVGDVSVGFATPLSGELDSLVPGLVNRVRRYLNRFV